VRKSVSFLFYVYIEVENVLNVCREYNYKNLTLLVWFINEEARKIIKDVNIATCVVFQQFLLVYNEGNILDTVKVQDYRSYIF